MKITIVTGMPYTDVIGFFKMMEKSEDSVVLFFPEYDKIEHPYKLYKRIASIATSCVEENKDLYIATFSEDVRGAIQIVCANKCVQAQVVCLDEYNTPKIGKIDMDGKEKDLPDGTLDTWYYSMLIIV